MIAAVAACNVCDIPHSVRSGSVLQWSSAQGISKSERVLFSFIGKVRIDICDFRIAVLLYPFSIFEESFV